MYIRFDDWAKVTTGEQAVEEIENKQSPFWSQMISYRAATRYLMDEFGFSESKAKRYMVASRDLGVWRIPMGFNQVSLNRKAFMSYVRMIRTSIKQQQEIESRR